MNKFVAPITSRFFLLMLAPALLAPTAALGAQKKACFRYPGDRYYDSSPREFYAQQDDCSVDADCDAVDGAVDSWCSSGDQCVYDFGEDKFLRTSSMKVRRAFTYVFRSDMTIAWFGHLNSNGCTGQFNSGNGPYDIWLYPNYYSTSTNHDFQVRDCNDGTCNVDIVLFDDVSLPGSSSTFPVPPEMAFDAYVATAYILDRLTPGYYSSMRDFRIDTKNSYGAATHWDSSNQEAVVELNNNKSRAKFIVGHELGHVMYLNALRTNSAIIDCSYGSPDPNEHSLFGLEYQSCASFEGYGHFFSAAAFNIMGNNASGYWATFSNNSWAKDFDVYNIENGSNELLAHCNGSTACGGPLGPGCGGMGVEMDWARTYWDFRTDSGTSKPHTLDPVKVVNNAHPYAWQGTDNCISGHYGDIKHSVNFTMGSYLEARFNGDAVYNGANY